MIGTTVKDFKIQKKLGAGGMATSILLKVISVKK